MKNVEESWDVREERSRTVQLQGRAGGGRVLHSEEKKKLMRLKVENKSMMCLPKSGGVGYSKKKYITRYS